MTNRILDFNVSISQNYDSDTKAGASFSQEKSSKIALNTFKENETTIHPQRIQRTKKENIDIANTCIEFRDSPTPPTNYIPPATKKLIELFWNPQTNRIYSHLFFTPETFKDHLGCYLQWFKDAFPDITGLNIFHKEYDTENLQKNELYNFKNLAPNEISPIIGYAQKIDLPPNTQIFVRADLHGNLNQLIENLMILQFDGFLDEDFKCKSNFRMIFLGDYCDRNPYNLPVLQLLMALKMENPRQVILIRGNHEDLPTNLYHLNSSNSHSYGFRPDVHFANFFFKNDSNRQALTNFYQTLPLALYVSESDLLNLESTNHRKYSLFTHGMIDPSFDCEPLLDDTNFIKSVPIFRERNVSLGIAKKAQIFKQFYFQDIQNYHFSHLENPLYINNLNWAHEKIKTLSENEKQFFTQMYCAYQTDCLAKITQNLQGYVTGKYPFFTLFTTLDIREHTKLPIGDEEANEFFYTAHDLQIGIEDTHAVLQATSGDNHTIEQIFKGHQHNCQVYPFNQKGLIYVLSAAPMEFANGQVHKGNGDVYGILTPHNSKDWEIDFFQV